MQTQVPACRIRDLNQAPINPEGQWVVYWMTAFRRTDFNFALQYARDWSLHLGRPLLVLEGLRCDYPWASARFHRFVIQGMSDNANACKAAGVAYYPYVEPQRAAGRGLLEALARNACLLVGDDFPCFFHPGMFRRLADRLSCRLSMVDANGLMPLSQADRTFTVAHSYRRWMQKTLPNHLQNSPEPQPLANTMVSDSSGMSSLPKSITDRWPVASLSHLTEPGGLSDLPIDHSVDAVELRGGAVHAQRLLKQFVSNRLARYQHDRNEPDLEGSTGLSPYLHFGHLSCHQLFWEIMERQQWNPSRLAGPNGKVEGFWGVDPNAEALLDQLCTWREIGLNMCWREPNYDAYDSLPTWAMQTLDDHRHDPRAVVYDLEQLEFAKTGDPIWNAAQRQLLIEGRMHNYLRMLWGKNILGWTKSPEQALQFMIDLNNKYALDGRDPNSYSGIFWVLGRYDRAWGPERQVFGKIRYMTSQNTARKHALRQYLAKYSTLT